LTLAHQLIVSEFALQAPATRDQQLAFLNSAMSFLDGASYVTYVSKTCLLNEMRLSHVHAIVRCLWRVVPHFDLCEYGRWRGWDRIESVQ
jgi:hypothetical protein